jgi:NAD(P)-dependent dehydrogenase (short-subunit alcohol dehydrogenase family)
MTPHPSKSAPVALVTGGSRGIGAACARLLAAQGYAVVVNYAERADAAHALVAELCAAGHSAWAVQADVADESQVLSMFAAIDSRMGRLDALVNNAGVVGATARLEACTAARFKRILDINVLGSLLCAREAVRRMSTRHGGQGGAIVNMGSAASRLGSPGQYVDYAAAKGAIDSFTLGLAREVAGEGIRVNAVRPGIIDTDIHASGGWPTRVADMQASLPMQRAGTADEVAQCVAWLLSDAASYTTGALIDVSGAR